MDSGFQIFSALMLFFAFRFLFETCCIERRCLECITSLFSFSIYKLREEMYYFIFASSVFSYVDRKMLN